MKRVMSLLLGIATLVTLVAGCASPTPLVIERTVEVEKEVEKTVEVEKIVEKTVEVEKEVEVMVKQLARKTAKSIELQSLNPDHPARTLAMSDVLWVARIMWASQ